MFSLHGHPKSRTYLAQPNPYTRAQRALAKPKPPSCHASPCANRSLIPSQGITNCWTSKKRKKKPLFTQVMSLYLSESPGSLLLCTGWHCLPPTSSIPKHPALQAACTLLLNTSGAAPEYAIALQHWINMQSSVKSFIFMYINHPQSPPRLYRSVLFVQLLFSPRYVFS